VALADMVLADVTRRAIDRVVTEYHQREKLRSHGLSAAARTRVREVSRCRDGHPQRQKGQPLDVHLLRQALKIPKATAESSLSLATLPHADWLRVLATTRLDIEPVSGTPGQLFYRTQIPVCLWILSKMKNDGKSRDRRKQSLFIDVRGTRAELQFVHVGARRQRVTFADH